MREPASFAIERIGAKMYQWFLIAPDFWPRPGAAGPSSTPYCSLIEFNAEEPRVCFGRPVAYEGLSYVYQAFGETEPLVYS